MYTIKLIFIMVIFAVIPFIYSDSNIYIYKVVSSHIFSYFHYYNAVL